MDKELERTQKEVKRRRLEFFKIFRKTHPNNAREKGREEQSDQFRKTLKEFREAKLVTPRYARCEECEIDRQMTEKFLGNIKTIISRVQEPLDPNDFIASIHYNKCYLKVLQNDMSKHRDGDLSIFEDIHELRDL